MKWAADLITRAAPKVIIAKLLSVLSAKNKGYNLESELKHELERRDKRKNFSNHNKQSQAKSQQKPAKPAKNYHSKSKTGRYSDNDKRERKNYSRKY